MSSSLYSGIVSVSYSDELPSHVDHVVDNIAIEMHLVEALQIGELVGAEVSSKHSDFLLSNLKIKNDLGKRILWISGILKLRSGREVQMKIPFGELEQGSYINVVSVSHQEFEIFGCEASKKSEADDSFFYN
jgi:hypothetical protein